MAKLKNFAPKNRKGHVYGGDVGLWVAAKIFPVVPLRIVNGAEELSYDIEELVCGFFCILISSIFILFYLLLYSLHNSVTVGEYSSVVWAPKKILVLIDNIETFLNMQVAENIIIIIIKHMYIFPMTHFHLICIIPK